MKAILPASKITVSSRGQLVIPKEIREAYGIFSGTEIIVRALGDGVIELKACKRNVADLFKDRGPPAGPAANVDEAIMQAVLENDDRTRTKKHKASS